MSSSSINQTRAVLRARLEARRSEIEEATLTRVYSVSDASASVDPVYAESLRLAVSAALDYGLSAVELGVERLPPVPATLLVQARLAVRNAIGLDTVLRRYVAGSTVLGDFIMQTAAEGDRLEVGAIHRIGRDQAALLDRLLKAVSGEYSRELESRRSTSETRLAERVRRLIAGELLDTYDLDYNLGEHHLGIVATGPGAAEALREFADTFDCRVLLVALEGNVWTWLGARRSLDPAEVERRAAEQLPVGVSLAIGEPSHGLAGWRLTHRQARAALPVALRSTPKRVIRYSDVALLASMLQDDVLVASLRELYLDPLLDERDGGEALRETLQAYISSERNLSSAAAALGVSRRTVANRLRAVEARIDRPLAAAMTDIEAALRLQETEALPSDPASRPKDN